jgi:predicted nucleotidyltransferase
MNNFQKILDSFSVKDTLNQKVWENPTEPNKAVMIPKVRKALMRIAEEFINYLGEDVFVDDIHLTGSLANFNWSEFSDFDLHVIVDFEQYEEQSDLYKELFNLKKQVFNDKHNIKIFGYDVELYAQDAEEPHYSSGVYSVMNNEWVNKPKKLKVEIDKSVLEKKIKSWTEKIDSAIEEGKDLEKIKTKLKDYRKSGLEKDGELSYENLVFKFLRRSGHIQKMFDTANKETDKELSIERRIEEQIK